MSGPDALATVTGWGYPQKRRSEHDAEDSRASEMRLRQSADPIRDVRVISTGGGAAHAEHLYGTSKPTPWWVFTSRRWVRLPASR